MCGVKELYVKISDKFNAFGNMETRIFDLHEQIVLFFNMIFQRHTEVLIA